MHPIVFPFLEANGGVAEPDSETPAYNCIAWAAGRTDVPWWPGSGGDTYWPADVPNEETIAAFLLVFATLGYEACESGTLEPGYEKVVLYALEGKPTHAARQLPDAKWTSKLGRGPVITHVTPHGVEGPLYGTVTGFLRRPIPRA